MLNVKYNRSFEVFLTFVIKIEKINKMYRYIISLFFAPGSGFKFRIQKAIESGSKTDPDPQPCNFI
jgi:hypothetical protein